MQIFRILGSAAVIFAGNFVHAADFAPPAGDRYPLIGAAGSILPGGRFLKPAGDQLETGPEPSALAVSPRGNIATADTGYERHGITIITPPGKRPGQVHHVWARTPHSELPEIADPDWTGVAPGIAFDGEKAIWVSEGESGRVRLVDAESGDRRKLINLNGPDWHGSRTSDLALDSVHHLLYAADDFNGRVAVIDTRKDRVLASITLGKRDSAPSAIALSPDGSVLYATVSGAVCLVDVRDPLKPAITDRVQTTSPGAILVTADRVFVSSPVEDTITVISVAERKVSARIRMAIPALEKFHGIEPTGMAYDNLTKWLLVAESGINAVGVIDTENNQLIGHIPAGWIPTRVAITGDRVYVANARGRGTGPYLRRRLLELGDVTTLHRGTVTTFIMPDTVDLARQTGVVMALDGFVPLARQPVAPPATIHHIVLIRKEGRSFDEVLGDVTKAGNGAVAGSPPLARFGLHGRAYGAKTQFSVQDAPITPNQHAIATRWALNDNFYAGDETSLREAWDYLKKSGLDVRNFDDEAGTAVPDQVRADRVIDAIDRDCVKGGQPLPRLISIHLPNDRTADARPNDGYPYAASFAEDNDLAAGRIVEYFSHSSWWPNLAIFIVETGTEGSFDHIDSHRTLLLAAGPYVKKDYASHTNASFTALARMMDEIFGVQPADINEATAPSLRDLFTAMPDFAPFTAVQPDPRVFDPAKLAPK